MISLQPASVLHTADLGSSEVQQVGVAGAEITEELDYERAKSTITEQTEIHTMFMTQIVQYSTTVEMI